MKVTAGFVALLTAASSVAAIPFLSAPEHEVYSSISILQKHVIDYHFRWLPFL